MENEKRLKKLGSHSLYQREKVNLLKRSLHGSCAREIRKIAAADS